MATSYALKCAIEKIGDYDLVFCGRQAIDGDTAQVGPQVAEKLGVPQITYAESMIEANEAGIVVRETERGAGAGAEPASSPALTSVRRRGCWPVSVWAGKAVLPSFLGATGGGLGTGECALRVGVQVQRDGGSVRRRKSDDLTWQRVLLRL